MNSPISRRSLLKLIGVTALGTLLPACRTPDLRGSDIPAPLRGEATMWDNTADYTYQWWAAGLRAPDKVFHIQTSRYGLAFDFHQFRLTRFGPIETPFL